MSIWIKRKKWRLSYGDFDFQYDTALELGRMVGESGCKMPNPYEPSSSDFDDFTVAKRGAVRSYDN